MIALMTKTIKGFDVVWANNGSIYFSRGLHDIMPEHMQGVALSCNTPREFDSICAQLAA